jgi:hypothetical protein
MNINEEQAKTIFELGRETGEAIGFLCVTITQEADHIKVIEKFIHYTMEIGAAFRPNAIGYYTHLIRPNGAYTTRCLEDINDKQLIEMQKDYDEKQPAIREAQRKLIEEALEEFPEPDKPSKINIELDDNAKKISDDL